MKYNRRTQNRRRAVPAGFTLFEMVLVLAIIALLIGVGVKGLFGVLEEASVTATKAQIGVVETQLVRYRTAGGMFPTTEQGLDALVNRPRTAPEPRSYEPLASETDLRDAYNQPLQYARPSTREANMPFDIWSIGEDGIDGTEDDIGNWEKK